MVLLISASDFCSEGNALLWGNERSPENQEAEDGRAESYLSIKLHLVVNTVSHVGCTFTVNDPIWVKPRSGSN